MATTPPAAIVPDEDDDAMQVDQPAVAPGEEADVESEGGPARSRSKSQSSKDANGTIQVESNKNEPVEIIDDDEDEDGDEETYAVEKVLNHRIAKKGNGQRGFQFYIKWLHYDKEEDNTWEDEENCQGSVQLIDAYWNERGGRPEITSSAQKRGSGRKHNQSTPASEGGTKRRRHSTDDDTPVRQKTNGMNAWEPPKDLVSWDDKVANVETVEKTENGLVLVYLHWKDGHKSCHDTTVVYAKCPQRMLQFYESHLVFKPADPE